MTISIDSFVIISFFYFFFFLCYSFFSINYLISIFSWRMFIWKLPWTLSILSMNLPGIWWLVVVVMAPKISNNPQQPCCIKFLHEIGSSSPLDMQQRYRILRAEICGFPMIYSPWPEHCAIILLSNNNLSLPFIMKMCNRRMKKTVGSIPWYNNWLFCCMIRPTPVMNNCDGICKNYDCNFLTMWLIGS